MGVFDSEEKIKSAWSFEEQKTAEYCLGYGELELNKTEPLELDEWMKFKWLGV